MAPVESSSLFRRRALGAGLLGETLQVVLVLLLRVATNHGLPRRLRPKVRGVYTRDLAVEGLTSA